LVEHDLFGKPVSTHRVKARSPLAERALWNPSELSASGEPIAEQRGLLAQRSPRNIDGALSRRVRYRPRAQRKAPPALPEKLRDDRIAPRSGQGATSDVGPLDILVGALPDHRRQQPALRIALRRGETGRRCRLPLGLGARFGYALPAAYYPQGSQAGASGSKRSGLRLASQ
jgi:hypothetical protein